MRPVQTIAAAPRTAPGRNWQSQLPLDLATVPRGRAPGTRGGVIVNDVRGGVLSPWLQRRRLRLGPAYLRGRVLDYGCGDGQLATICRPKAYLGVDVNLRALDQARAAHPEFRFATSVSDRERFDTVAAFAFIEHVADPGAWLARVASLLEPGGRIVLTTPHPSWEWAHTLGARTHLFSWDAHQEHQELLDRTRLQELASDAGLLVETYRRFLLGANQLVVLRRADQPSASKAA
jgi:2-polyprenyl-3-methyl-5-hydroxy-6-metoxy-1,4-benzoquinol methylase